MVHWCKLRRPAERSRITALINQAALETVQAPVLFAASALLLWSSALKAAVLSGTKTISPIEFDGRSHQVAEIDFKPSASGTLYEIRWKDKRFSDHFLSMRPFKCPAGPAKYWCRVPYPYENRRRVKAEDGSGRHATPQHSPGPDRPAPTFGRCPTSHRCRGAANAHSDTRASQSVGRHSSSSSNPRRRRR